MILTEAHFEKLADSISNDFLKTGTSLEDGILKVAHEIHLNPDQIRQLARITNVRTHLELFEKSSSDNKIVEFPVADPDKILAKFYDEPVKTASFDDAILDFGMPLADKRPELEKTAEADLPEYKKYATLSFADSKGRMAVRKIAEELEGKLLEAKEVYKLGCDKMATELRKYNADAPAVLAQIHSMLGKEAECIIVDVSTRARLAAPVGLVKSAGIIDDRAPIFKLAQTVNDAYRVCIKLAIANSKLHKQLKENGL